MASGVEVVQRQQQAVAARQFVGQLRGGQRAFPPLDQPQQHSQPLSGFDVVPLPFRGAVADIGVVEAQIHIEAIHIDKVQISHPGFNEGAAEGWLSVFLFPANARVFYLSRAAK